MKNLLTLGIGLCVVCCLSLPARAASGTPKRGGTLNVAIEKDMVVLNPLVGTRSTDQSVRELVFEPLLAIDRKGNFQPHLAESWQVSKDGKSYTFKLRRGVKFHNGQEMTAEDVKFAVDYTLNPKNGAYGQGLLNLVTRAEALDKYTFRLTLKDSNPGLLSFLAEIKAFSIVPKGSLQEGADKPNRFPPGTGPFQFVEWQPRQRIVLDRFEGYWGPKALLDRVVFRPVRDSTVRLTALRAGDVELVERTPLEWVRQVVDGKLKGIVYSEAAHADLRALLFNVADPPFNNKKLRQAIAMAMDKREILHAAYLGFGSVNDQKYPKGHAWYFEGLPWPSANPERARALLKEAGYKGETIPIITSPESSDQTMALTLQAQLKKIGMTIALDTLEVSTYNDRDRKGEFAFRFRGGDFYPDPWSTYGRDLRCEPDLRRRVSNRSGYCDKEMEGLLAKAETEPDATRRKELFRQIMTKAAEEVPEIFLGSIPRFFTLRDYVKGFATDDAGRFMVYGGGLSHTWLDKEK